MPFCEYLISVIVFPLKTALPSLADGDIPLAYGIFFKTHPKVCLLWRSQGKSMCSLEKCTGATWHGVERLHCPCPGTIISGPHLNQKKPAPEDSLAALQGRHGRGAMLERAGGWRAKSIASAWQHCPCGLRVVTCTDQPGVLGIARLLPFHWS